MAALEVVAVILLNRGRMALLRRSQAVDTEKGQWHCVTGHLPPGTQPLDQAYREAEEELGLSRDQLDFVQYCGRTVVSRGHESWSIHPFVFAASDDNVRTNWENSEVHWVAADELRLRECVWWLSFVLATCELSPSRRQTP